MTTEAKDGMFLEYFKRKDGSFGFKMHEENRTSSNWLETRHGDAEVEAWCKAICERFNSRPTPQPAESRLREILNELDEIVKDMGDDECTCGADGNTGKHYCYYHEMTEVADKFRKALSTPPAQPSGEGL